MHDGSIREFMLAGALQFVERARACAGVKRIALVGSLATTKEAPKDVDMLVTVEDGAELAALARAGRQLKGHAVKRKCGADIFLADLSGRHIGRICHYRECWHRVVCGTRRCGDRRFLCDDRPVPKHWDTGEAPLELWPVVVRRGPIPADVEQLLARPLQDSAGPAAPG